MPTFVHTYEKDMTNGGKYGKCEHIYRISYESSPKIVLVDHNIWKLSESKILSMSHIDGIYSTDNDGFVSDMEWRILERMIMVKLSAH